MGAIPLKINDLLLDTDNPRLRSPETQRDALQQMLADQKDRLSNLAEHIAQHGMNPMDRMMVLRVEGSPPKFVALEGNRRVAALKILANTSVLSGLHLSTSEKKRFDKFAATFHKRTVEPIDAFEMATREESRPWIELRHTGANGGRGLVSWEGIQTARFRGESGVGLQALEFIKEHANLDDESLSLLDRGFPITTLDRLMKSKAVRERMGLTLTQGKLESTIPGRELLKPLKKIILDLATKAIKVGKVMTSEQQATYLDSFSGDDKADLSEEIESASLSAFSAKDFKAASKPRTRRSNAERLTVVPKTLKLNIADDRVAGIFQELKDLRFDQTPNAAAVLLRVFLELSVDHYLSTRNIPLEETKKNQRTEPKTLNAKVKECIALLVTGGAKQRDFLSVSVGIDKASSPLYTGLLNAYVHNRYLTPRGTELRSTWSDAQPFFEAMWK
jgi:hypothetical protein